MTTTTPNLTGARIMETAKDLFSARGFHGTGIRSIADGSNISLATLYHYIGTKEGLLLMMMTENIESLTALAKESIQNSMDPTKDLRALVAAHIIAHIDDRKGSIISDSELRALTPESRVSIVKLRDSYEELWRDVLTKGRESGEFEIDDPSVTSKALINMCTGVAYWYRETGPLKIREITEMYAKLCVNAVASAHKEDE